MGVSGGEEGALKGPSLMPVVRGSRGKSSLQFSARSLRKWMANRAVAIWDPTAPVIT
jgi:6-phosphogluconate dehydrogenase